MTILYWQIIGHETEEAECTLTEAVIKLPDLVTIVSHDF